MADVPTSVTGNMAPGDAVEPAQAAEVENTEVAEEGQEGVEAVEGQEASAEAKAEQKKEEKKIAALKKKLKLKVDGEEFEEEVDFENEQELVKKLQMAKVAQKRMNQYSQLEREVEQFLTELKKNPRKILSDPKIGIDVKQLAASIIEEEIENSKKSPEQLEREKLEAELQAIKEEREREKEESRKRELERLQQQEYERYDMLMTKALEKSDLPKSPYVVKKMADYMLMGLNNGLDIGPDDVLPLVRDEIHQDLKDMFAVMPDEVIEAVVGKDVFNRVRKKNVAKAKASAPAKPKIQDTGAKEAKEEQPVAKKSYKDFFGL